MPLRDIDRSRFIKLIDGAPLSYPNEKWIRIRFPFSKKLIAELDHMLRLFNLEDNHSKGSHEHHCKLTERAVFELVSRFQSRQFIIDQEFTELQERYNIMNIIIIKKHISRGCTVLN